MILRGAPFCGPCCVAARPSCPTVVRRHHGCACAAVQPRCACARPRKGTRLVERRCTVRRTRQFVASCAHAANEVLADDAVLLFCAGRRSRALPPPRQRSGWLCHSRRAVLPLRALLACHRCPPRARATRKRRRRRRRRRQRRVPLAPPQLCFLCRALKVRVSAASVPSFRRRRTTTWWRCGRSRWRSRRPTRPRAPRTARSATKSRRRSRCVQQSAALAGWQARLRRGGCSSRERSH